MTAADLKKIETALGIRLPADYRAVMTAQGAELAKKVLPGASKATPFFKDNLYPKSAKLIRVNQEERAPGMGTAEAFPGWEKTFVLIGSSGAGDYYCMRLDDTPGVYQIGSDCGSEPVKLFPSLKAYIDDQLRDYGYALLESQVKLRRTPPPGLSSFKSSCPPADRVAVYLNAGPVSGNGRVVYQGDDTHLSAESLKAGGIDLDEVCRCAARLVTLLLRAPAGRITATAECDEESPEVKLNFEHVPGEHFDRGYWYVAVEAAGAGAEVGFDGLIGNPPPAEVACDWQALKPALAALLEAACPGKVTFRIADPGPVSVRKNRRVYPLPFTIA
jgi:hypothetical protein